MSEIDLLPRADLPVIWDAFKAQAEPVRQIAETLTVTDISQKEEMALARKTRLTLREIRIAVEHKRVELGEGHLKEIQKVNGAAKAIREFIEPLEARLLVQESYAERAEEKRIALLAESRFLEVEAIKPRAVWVPAALAAMPQEEYDGLVARLRAEQAELEESNRLRVEAEKQLAEVRAEAQKRAIELQLELKAESDRLKAERSKEAAARKEIEDRAAAERQEAEEKYRREQAEKDRIRDEQLAKLEAELAKERAAKQAEADAARRLALAPDIEKLIAFAKYLREIKTPLVSSVSCQMLMDDASSEIIEAAARIETFCERN